MFAPECFPPAGAESIVTSKLLIAAMKSGWKIDVISHKNSGQYYPSNTAGCWSGIPEILHNIGTTQFFKNRRDKKSFRALILLKRLESLIWVFKAVNAGRRLLKQYRYDFIMSRIMPEYGHLPALILSYSFNIPWIANWSDPMPREKAPAPFAQGISSKIPFLKSIYCQEVAKKASWHTFPSERLRKYVCSYLPICETKSSMIPHIALDNFRLHSPQNNKVFTLCHPGGLGLRKPNIFLEGVRLFLEKYKIDWIFSIKFVGPPEEHLRKTIKKLGLEKIITIEKAMTYEETLEIISNSSVSVVIEAPSKEGIFFPSKVVDFVQTGRPILAVSPIVGTLSDLLSIHGGGIVADCRSSVAVSTAIETFYTEWKAGTLYEKYGSFRLYDQFGEQHILKQYGGLFNRLTKNKVF